MYVMAYSFCLFNAVFGMTTCASSKDNSPIRKKVKHFASALHTKCKMCFINCTKQSSKTNDKLPTWLWRAEQGDPQLFYIMR